MFYLDHCQKAIRDQIRVLKHYQSEVEELDYEFIRNHALSIYQFSDHMCTVSGKPVFGEGVRDALNRVDSYGAEECRKALREQIEMLWQYLEDDPGPDMEFVRTHAIQIMRYCDYLRRNGASAI